MVRNRIPAALLFGLAACSDAPAGQCVIAADCLSGVCGPDGVCLVAPDAGPVGDAGSNTDGGPATDAGRGVSCRPNRDGFIGSDEIPAAAGVHANVRVALDTTAETAGQFAPDGTRRWDLSAGLPGDQTVEARFLPINGQWFAGAFPGATYAARLAQSDDLLGVFEATEGELLLRGVVSPEGGAGRTELTYADPIAVLAFPLTFGASWQRESLISGLAAGIPAQYRERYEQQVDAVGALVTPLAEFPVLRVRFELTRTVGLATTRVRTYLFVSECAGTVARIVSRDQEPELEFERAAEVLRLAP